MDSELSERNINKVFRGCISLESSFYFSFTKYITILVITCGTEQYSCCWWFWYSYLCIVKTKSLWLMTTVLRSRDCQLEHTVMCRPLCLNKVPGYRLNLPIKSFPQKNLENSRKRMELNNKTKSSRDKYYNAFPPSSIIHKNRPFFPLEQ